MKPWETLSSEVLHKNPWTSFHKDRFRMPNGFEGDYYYMKTPAGSVVIVPVLADGRLVLHREYRYLFDRVSLEFPCGGIKVEQTPDVAAHAELEEETGYKAQVMEYIHKIAPSNGMFKEYSDIYLATGLTDGDAKPDKTEEFEVVLMTPEEVDQAIEEKEIWDGFTIIAWQLTRQKVLDTINKL